MTVELLHFSVRTLTNNDPAQTVIKECVESVEHRDAKDNPQSFVYHIFWVFYLLMFFSKSAKT